MIKTGHLANHENLGWRRNNGWGGGAYTCMQLFVFVLFLGVFFQTFIESYIYVTTQKAVHLRRGLVQNTF